MPPRLSANPPLALLILLANAAQAADAPPITTDQERQRANLASAPRDSDLAKRSLTAISLQEDELGLLSKTRTTLEADRNKAQQALEAGVMAIKF